MWCTASRQRPSSTTGHVGPNLAQHLVAAIPASSLRKINLILGRNFVTKYGTKRGGIVLGKQAPLVIAAGGNGPVTNIANQTGATWSGYAAGDHTESHNPRPENA